MEIPKGRSSGASSEPPKKVSPRAVKQLKVNSRGSSSPASPSSLATRTPKERSPKVTERRSPRSPIPEKKHPSKIPELESQVSELQEDVKKVKEQLTASESSKEEAQSNAEELKTQLVGISLKLEESQKKVSDLLALKDSRGLEHQTTIEEKNQDQSSQVEVVRLQQSLNASALASALDEIQTLKNQLEAKSESAQSRVQESTDSELQTLKNSLTESVSLLETMKTKVKDCKESEARAQQFVRETLLQLEAAKRTVSDLRSDGIKATDAYKTTKSELDESRARVEFLEDLVTKLKANMTDAKSSISENTLLNGKSENLLADDQLEVEFKSLRSEVGQLKCTLEAAEVRFRDAQEQSSAQIKSAYELVDQMKSQSGLRMANVESELKKARSEIEELKTKLMDKETKLQGIVEENESLNLKLAQQSVSCLQENELENETKRLREEVFILKSHLMDKENELQSISEVNEKLESQIVKKDVEVKGDIEDGLLAREVESSKAGEKDALEKLSLVMEEAKKSKKRAERAGEQLEAAQATMAEMEAELRRLKVQSNQWRKAAEAAASMLSSAGGVGGNGKYVERTGSLDNNGYSPVISGRISSPYLDDYEDVEGFKKKSGNANVLGKIGGLWKKPQK